MENKNLEPEKEDIELQDLNNEDKKADENYMVLGMCLGTSLGIVFGQLFLNDLAIGMSIGMCLGLAMGVCIKKKK